MSRVSREPFSCERVVEHPHNSRMSDILVTTIGLSCGRDLHCSLLGPLAKVAQQSEPKAKKTNAAKTENRRDNEHTNPAEPSWDIRLKSFPPLYSGRLNQSPDLPSPSVCRIGKLDCVAHQGGRSHGLSCGSLLSMLAYWFRTSGRAAACTDLLSLPSPALF